MSTIDKNWRVVGRGFAAWVLCLMLLGVFAGAGFADGGESDAILVAPNNPLEPVKTETPRDTMETYLNAMRDYKLGLDNKNPKHKARIYDAVRCLDLSKVDSDKRSERGKLVAILLKEVIDRHIIVDLSKIPTEGTPADAEKKIPAKPLTRWRLRGTDIVIKLVEEGDRKGEFLFSTDTVARVDEFYDKIKSYPYLDLSDGGAGYLPPKKDVYQASATWIETRLPDWFLVKMLSIPRWKWIGIFLAILIGFAMRMVARGLSMMVIRLTQRTRTDWDEKLARAMTKPIALLAATAVWFLALNVLNFKNETTNMFFFVLLQVLLSLALIWLMYRIIDVLGEYLIGRALRTETKLDNQLVKLVTTTLKTFVVIFGVLVCVQNLGFNVFSLMAGLGIGGLAVAMAAKDTLSNFFGSIMIMLDKPFRVGDWVICGSAEGTVEEIGFRSTKIRTFYDSLISIPNMEVAAGHVDNMGRRQYRRVKEYVGITYDTPPEKIEAFLEGIKNIIKNNSCTRKDSFYVAFERFGSSSLDILLYFFLKVPDRASELIERQNIFLEIIRLAKELEIDFAFPTQSLHVETFPEKQGLTRHETYDKASLVTSAASFGKGGQNAMPAGSGIFVPPHKE